jgi:hypothetical protein
VSAGRQGPGLLLKVWGAGIWWRCRQEVLGTPGHGSQWHLEGDDKQRSGHWLLQHAHVYSHVGIKSKQGIKGRINWGQSI